MSFYGNRKGNEGKPKPKEDPELSFVQDTPRISQNSRQMAEESRKKLLGEGKGGNIVTMLYEKDKVRT